MGTVAKYSITQGKLARVNMAFGGRKKMDIGQLPQRGNFPGASNVLGQFSVLMVCTMHTIHNFFAQKNAKAKNSP